MDIDETPPTQDSANELEKLQKIADEHQANYLRVLAEMENMRKRLQKEKTDFLKYGFEELFKELLPVLDSCETALADAATSSQKDLEAFQRGFELIRKQLLDKLSRFGLSPVEAKGEKFDPNFHQAIQKNESNEVAIEVVEQEFMKGYRLHDRLLRASMVSVLVPKTHG